jgi:hypothetical protein
MTPNQFEMLMSIALDEFQPTNGRPPAMFEDTDWVWADNVIMSAEDRGTFTSLVNAGLAEHNHLVGRESCVRMTEAGFNAYKEKTLCNS